MPEILDEIREEAKRFLDGDRAFVERTIHREANIDVDGSSINIEQSKLIGPKEMELVRAQGALALATTTWFNDVEWLQKPHKEEVGWRDLRLNATYPLDYFDEKPVVGSFIGSENDMRWLDQYGSVGGFGNNKGITVYRLEFVAPGSRSITCLRYPEDPTALEAYNARYRQYMDDLDSAESSISYYRGWDRVFSSARDKTPRVIGGLSFAGVGINEVLRQGSPAAEDEESCTRLLLHYEPEQNGYVGRDIVITDDEAITEPYWDGEEDREEASEELLVTALKLIRDATIPRP